MKIRVWNILSLAILNVLLVSGLVLMPDTPALAFLYDLTVTISPTGGGTVRDDTSVIDCPGDCTALPAGDLLSQHPDSEKTSPSAAKRDICVVSALPTAIPSFTLSKQLKA